MKYLLSCLVALVALPAHAVPMIDLVPSNAAPGLNAVFTVDVVASGIEAGDPLLAFGFDVQLGAGLSYSGATVASPFLDDSTVFITTDVAGSTLPAVSGDGILLSTLSLNAGNAAGVWDISIIASQDDLGASEGLFTVTGTLGFDETVSVEVVEGAPVPLPSTLLLMGLGILGLGIRARQTRSPSR